MRPKAESEPRDIQVQTRVTKTTAEHLQDLQRAGENRSDTLRRLIEEAWREGQ